MTILTFPILPGEDGLSVNTVLRRGRGCSGTLLKAVKRCGGILLDGAPVPVSHTARAGQTLSLALPDDPEDGLTPLPAPLDIFFEDEHLLILNKPPLVAVHPTSGHHDGTLAGMVKAHYLSRGERHLFRPVNRLDSGTSGLMAVAKHSYAQERLIAQLHTPEFTRRYLALCTRAPSPDSGTVDAPIGRVPGEVLRREVRWDGKRARTHYRTLTVLPGGEALVELILDTGRTHQIRVHMAYLGCALLGDHLYGKECPERIGRPALHACALTLRHPVTGERLSFSCPLPGDMAALSALAKK